VSGLQVFFVYTFFQKTGVHVATEKTAGANFPDCNHRPQCIPGSGQVEDEPVGLERDEKNPL
jgi:hypothetical protein